MVDWDESPGVSQRARLSFSSHRRQSIEAPPCREYFPVASVYPLALFLLFFCSNIKVFDGPVVKKLTSHCDASFLMLLGS